MMALDLKFSFEVMCVPNFIVFVIWETHIWSKVMHRPLAWLIKITCELMWLRARYHMLYLACHSGYISKANLQFTSNKSELSTRRMACCNIYNLYITGELGETLCFPFHHSTFPKILI